MRWATVSCMERKSFDFGGHHDEVIKGIEDCIELAPLHNPANLKGITAARKLLGPGIPQVAVFDTAFHSTMPETFVFVRHSVSTVPAAQSAPLWISRHLTPLCRVPVPPAHRQETRRDQHHHTPSRQRLLACAIQAGNSVDYVHGIDAPRGLVMGTRAGDLDAGVLEFLSHKEGMSLHEIDQLLNKQSGLLGFQD